MSLTYVWGPHVTAAMTMEKLATNGGRRSAECYLVVMDQVPPFVHEEVVSRPGLGNVEELQTLLVESGRREIITQTYLLWSQLFLRVWYFDPLCSFST